MAEYDAQSGRVSSNDLSAAQREADEMDLQAGVARVAGLVAGAGTLEQLLSEVARFAAHAIPGVDGASVAIRRLRSDAISTGGVAEAGATVDAIRIQTVSAAAGFVTEIDRVQYEDLREGPCITAMQTNRVAVSGSLGSDDRWPRFGGRVARVGVHSALSLPLSVDPAGPTIGAINAYARARDAFGGHAVELGSRFAAPAAVSVYNAQLLADARDRAERLQRALTSRAVIDQAIGIVRSRSGGTAEEAFEKLKRLSQADNVKLVVIAEQLVNAAVRRADVRRGD